MKIWKVKIHFIAEEIFQYSLITYLILLLAETVKEGFVSFFLNLYYLLIIVVLSGIVMVVTHHKEIDKLQKKQKSSGKDFEQVFLLSVGTALFVFAQTSITGTLGIVIAGITAVVFIIFSVILLFEKK